jgi:hypothetical protein
MEVVPLSKHKHIKCITENENSDERIKFALKLQDERAPKY